MHSLSRLVRFSIDPFLSEQVTGYNSFASKPAGAGLSLFLEIMIELVGNINPETGFVVNVSDIDREVRKHVVPLFTEKITQDFRRSKHITFSSISELLFSASRKLSGKFADAEINKISLKLNPFRTITIHSEDNNMVLFSEKFDFAATHKLWNDKFTEQQNMEAFGKCANPTGHGHNYTIEITVKLPDKAENFNISEFEKTIDRELIDLVDHKNLNVDIEHFETVNPTVENITTFVWNRLRNKFSQGLLHGITIWENNKTFCSYYG